MANNLIIVAGEASGDQHGAALVRECKTLRPDLKFTGIGGDKMRAAGVDTIIDISDLAVVGFVEVLAHFPTIYKTFKKIEAILKSNPPDLLILVDYPGFNLRLAKVAKNLGIKVLFYISPQVWAWRQGRVKKISQVVDHMAVIFPFEVDFYKNHDVPVTYVGHPLTHEVKATMTKVQAQEKFKLNPNKKVIALLPGSRQSELKRLLPTMLDSAKLLVTKHPDLQFILLQASTITDDFLNTYLKTSKIEINVIKNQSYDAMLVADALMIASGTATLEAALMEIPMVVIYKITPLTAAIAKHLIKINNIALVNIVAGERVVPELLQNEANPQRICQEIENITYNLSSHAQIVKKLRLIRAKMGSEDGSKNVAKLVITMLTSQGD